MEKDTELQPLFSQALISHDKEKAIKLITDALKNRTHDVKTLYETILAPSLNQISSNQIEQELPIWEEHLSSSIVRSALEITYPFVLAERDAGHSVANAQFANQKAVVFCLEEEYHELGARMITDFLTILGFDAYYIGANTPKREILKAIAYFEPTLVCISVTNFYHLTKLHSLIEELKLKEIQSVTPFTLIVGGYAVQHSSNVDVLVKADYYANTFEDLKKIKEAILCV